jgi:hypothetical protein
MPCTRETRSNHEAEFAVVIEDERQARGLGTILLAEIAEEARRAGIEVITGVVLAKNRRVLSLVRRVLPGFLSLCRTSTCTIRVPLAVPLIEATPEGEGGPTNFRVSSRGQSPQGKDLA